MEADGQAETAESGHLKSFLTDAQRPGAPPPSPSSSSCKSWPWRVKNQRPAERPVSTWTPRELADEAVKRGIVEQISLPHRGTLFKR